MKYVALQHPATGLIEYRMGLLTSHADLAKPLVDHGCVAQSAGFIRFLPEGRFETFGSSDSLKIGPHADDARAISAFYAAGLKTAGK
jgi:hypothetical protein